MKRYPNQNKLAAAVLLSLLSLPVLAEKPLAEQGQGSGKHHGQKMLEKFDLDGDGRINKAEFMALHGDKFDRMDSNGNGFIEADERKNHHKMMKQKHQEMKEKHQQKKAQRAE